MRKKHPGRLIASAALTVVSMMIATVAVAQAPPPPEPKIPPTLVPSHVVDLMTAEGIAAFGGRWKTIEV